MPAGRPPVPTHTKKVRGNPGKRKLNDDPTPPPAPRGGVLPPAWTEDSWEDGCDAVRMWDHVSAILAPMGLLTTADADSLALYCDAYAEYQAAGELIAAEGMTFTRTTDRGGESVQANPAVAMRADAWRRMERMLSQFGMNPVARSRVHAPESGEVDPFEAHDGPAIANGRRVQ